MLLSPLEIVVLLSFAGMLYVVCDTNERVRRLEDYVPDDVASDDHTRNG